MNEQPNDKQPQGDALQTARQTYNLFDNFVTIREDDSISGMACKLLLHGYSASFYDFVISFLLIGLAIAFAAVL